jgi:hypothetical protein
MKTLRFCFFLTFLAVPAALATADTAAKSPKPPAQTPLTARFKQVRERIDALFSRRNEAPLPPDPRNNPFRAPGEPIAVPRTDGTGPVPDPVSNLSLLQQSAATLRVSGVFEISGRTHLVINARPYKEGDFVQTQVRGETVQLRVRQILKRSVTFELNDAELTVKF